MQATNEAYIVSSVRTAVGKADRGTLRNYRPEALGAEAVKGAIGRVEGLTPEQVDDVIMQAFGALGVGAVQLALLFLCLAGQVLLLIDEALLAFLGREIAFLKLGL